MRFSAKFQASSHCLPSPDGRMVATLLPSGIHVRTVDHLDQVADVIPLPADLAVVAVVAVRWSPSSQRLLVATSDQILVAAALSSDSAQTGNAQPFRAIIRNPSLPAVARPAFVDFGPDDDHVYLCSAHGIKFSIFHIQTGKTVEITSPKLFSSATVASRGFSLRPGSHHLALLTRTAGKDWISVHDPTSSTPLASWSPDTIDAQGLVWSPDGRWLAAWESPAHGHKIVFYTPDGHPFKTWTGGGCDGPRRLGRDKEEVANASTVDESMGAGVRLVQFSPNARLLAVGDVSRCIRLIDTVSTFASKRLMHPTTLKPLLAQAQVKIWQEQIDLPPVNIAIAATHTFIEAVHDVSPPGRNAVANVDTASVASGCSLLAFDCTSKFLATRLEEAPSTIWVWNLETCLLCTVLMFHASVSSVVWHPDAPHTLLITPDGDRHNGLGVVWNPLSGAPRVADFAQYSRQPLGVGGPSTGKHHPAWLGLDGYPPSLFYTDGHEFSFATLDEDSQTRALPWSEAAPPAATSSVLAGQKWAAGSQGREESPLELVPAGVSIESDSEMDDTFHYKRAD